MIDHMYWYVIFNDSIFLILKAPDPRRRVKINVNFFRTSLWHRKEVLEVTQGSIKIKNYVDFKKFLSEFFRR